MKGMCRDCWDPVDKPGAEVCDWCAMTPAQQNAELRRKFVWLFVFFVGIGIAIWWLP